VVGPHRISARQQTFGVGLQVSGLGSRVSGFGSVPKHRPWWAGQARPVRRFVRFEPN